MSKVFILDTETTGLTGIPTDEVVEVGIVRVDTVTCNVLEIYNEVIRYDVDSWPDSKKNAWVFQNTNLTLDDVRTGIRPEAAAEDIRYLAELTGFPWSSYNIHFDFKKFLNKEPWNFHPTILFDVMDLASEFVTGDFIRYDGTPSYPKLEKAYSALCPDDPAKIGQQQTHRAADDATMAAYVYLACLKRSEEELFDSEGEIIIIEETEED